MLLLFQLDLYSNLILVFTILIHLVLHIILNINDKILIMVLVILLKEYLMPISNLLLNQGFIYYFFKVFPIPNLNKDHKPK